MHYDVKPWRETVLELVRSLGKAEFHLRELYAFEDHLTRLYPSNNNIREKIRQQLQFLAEDDFTEPSGKRGVWRFLGIASAEFGAVEPELVQLDPRPLPNAPLEAAETQSAFGNDRSFRDRMRDKALGDLGEQIVVANERKGLSAAGQPELAAKVEQVSKTMGDYLGFDVLSFEPNGSERWIEVKTTTGRAAQPFHISENQLVQSERHSEEYRLYRLYDFKAKSIRVPMYRLYGSLRPQLHLRPESYSAMPIRT